MSKITKDDYIVCRYKGESGDVIAGQVLRIRAGKAYMKNLLTGADSQRALDIVNRRNITVPRDVALSVAQIFHDTEDKQKARKAAVEAAEKVKAEEEKTVTDTKIEVAPKRKPGRPPKAKAVVATTNGAPSTNGTNGHAAPKRRGRPPGAKNKAKTAVVAASNGALSVHVQVSSGGKVLVDKTYSVKE